MTKIELLTARPDGTGEFNAHLDDGSSFHQSFQGAPVDDPVALLAYMASIAERVIERQAPVRQKSIPASVTAMVGKKLDVVFKAADGAKA